MRWLVVVLVLTSSCAGKLEHDAAYDFGAVPVGTSVLHPITLRNAGAAAIDVDVSGEGSAFVVEDARVHIAPGAAAVVGVRFSPTKLGDETGALTLAVGAVRTVVTLAGVGAGASATVAARSIDFGTVLWVDDKPLPEVRRLRVTNDGVGVAFTPDLATVGTELCIGTHVEGVCQPWQAAPLEPGASVDVPISFLPTAVGARRWTVNVRGAPLSIEVNVTAEVIEGERCSLVMEPLGLVFGASAQLTLRHVGAEPCSVASFEVEQPLEGAGFEAQTPWLLSPGEARSVAVRLTQAPVEETTWVLLRAFGPSRDDLGSFFVTFARDEAVCLLVSPAELALGAVGERCGGEVRSLQLYNQCDFPLTLSSVATAGDAFSWSSLPSVGAVLPPGQAHVPVISAVTFTPPTTGSFAGSLSLGVNGKATRHVAVTGEGVTRALERSNYGQQLSTRQDVLVAIDASPSFVPRRPLVRERLRELMSLLSFSSCADRYVSLIPAEGAADASVQWVASSTGQTSFSARADGGLAALQDAFDQLPVGSETESCVAAADAVVTEQDAGLIVFCVTDAREQAADAVLRAQALRGRRPFMSWHTVGPFGSDACGWEAPDDGVHAAVAASFGGSTEALCGDFWWPSWGNGGFPCDRTDFYLTSRPDLAVPITITHDGVIVPPIDAHGDVVWAYDATHNRVQFTAPPAGPYLEISFLPACR